MERVYFKPHFQRISPTCGKCNHHHMRCMRESLCFVCCTCAETGTKVAVPVSTPRVQVAQVVQVATA
jgi:hypothetical protein